MSATLCVGIEGVGVWTPCLIDWNAARAHLCDEVPAEPHGCAPAARILPANERRRAPEAVRLALEVAEQACAMAVREPAGLPNVFVSAYGDLEVNDYLCATLARAPREVSPTRFHNSVHNAGAGYWSIAGQCMHSCTAMSAGRWSFGAGLFEAALRVVSDATAVLFVASDVASCGLLRDLIACSEPFGVALVLAPPTPRCLASVALRVGHAGLAREDSLSQASQGANPAADGLSLLRALARREPARLSLAAGPALDLDLEIAI